MLQQTRSTPIFTGRAAVAQAVESFAEAAPSIRIIRGRKSILGEQGRLADLARLTGQTGEADNLEYFLSTPHALKKTPCLLLFADRSGESAVSATGLTAAVLLFEYRTPLGRSGVFSTADGSGRRDVLAPPAMRARAAAQAARALVERGAHIVHLAFSETHSDAAEAAGLDQRPSIAEQIIGAAFRNSGYTHHRAEWTLMERDISAYLPLLPSFDATLARIGQRTRSNLRYYRRRAETDLGADFVPDAEISPKEFLAFNRECMYPVPDAQAAFRHRTLSTVPRYCVRGVRDREGRWLSLVGTRRQNGFVEIDWQMNRTDLPASSLGIVMRSYLIEHEIALGSTRLYIEGGTPQPIGRSFLKERVSELTVKRKSAPVHLLERFASIIFPPANYLGQTLSHPDLRWRPW